MHNAWLLVGGQIEGNYCMSRELGDKRLGTAGESAAHASPEDTGEVNTILLSRFSWQVEG